jgi:hypothetical protein
MTCGHEELFERYHAGGLDPAEEAEVRHTLNDCPACRRRLDLRTARTALGRGALIAVAAVVVALGALAFLLATRGAEEPSPAASAPPEPLASPPPPPREPPRQSPRWRDAKVAKAPYTSPRSRKSGRAGETADDRPRETSFDRAMRPYARNDFDAAAEALVPLARAGDTRASFYLGVSLLLLDRNEDAVAPLERASAAWRGQLGSQAHYYLGVAYLRTYRFEEALRELLAAQQGGGPYAAKAAELEEEVRSSAL